MLTKIVSIAVPANPGDGVASDISSLVGEKTVQLTGSFTGAYTLYVSHDGSHWAPFVTFNSGSDEEIKTTFSGSFKYAKIVSRASSPSGVFAYVSGLEDVGDNSFTTMVIPAGWSGTTIAIDLGATDYQQDLNFIVQGGFKGTIIVEGSLDGTRYNPIESVSSPPSANTQQSLEFSPLQCLDRIRYVRAAVVESTTTPVALSIGGRRLVQLTAPQQLAVADLEAAWSVSITDYGADRTGVEFSDDAIAAAIAAAKASQTRRSVYCPPGFYKISRSIEIKQAHGLTFVGAGPDATIFIVSGVIPGPALDLNGVSVCTFGGFSICADSGYNAPSSIESGVRYWWDGTGSSSYANVFRDIYVCSARYKVGFQVGSDLSLHNSGQEDQTFWYSCRCVGGNLYSVYDPTWWQEGIRVGSGIHGNNLLHNFYGVVIVGHVNGVREAAGEAIFLGGCVQNNQVDWMFSATGPVTKYWKVCGIRSENSGRFISSTGASLLSGQLSFENCEFDCVSGYVAADRILINLENRAGLNLSNITIHNIDPSYKPRIRYWGTCLRVDGMNVGYGDPADMFDLAGSGCAVVNGVNITDASGFITDKDSFGDGVRVLSTTGWGLKISHLCGTPDVRVGREGGVGPGAMVLDNQNGVMPFGLAGPRWLYKPDTTGLVSAPVIGDVVWNSAPASGGYVGWSYTAAGWKGFGVIA